MIGETFGRLTVVARANRRSHFHCLCTCGASKDVRSDALRTGNTRSCGCLRRDVCSTHGHTRPTAERKSGEYSSWDHMIQRCTNANHKHYHRYGGRGVKLYDRWRHSFETFLADMGPKPTPAHTIDRIDPNGNYEPSNCRWATRAEQMLNLRRTVYVEWEGENQPMQTVAKSFGIDPKVVDARLRKGWDIARSLTQPIDYSRSHKGPRNGQSSARNGGVA